MAGRKPIPSRIIELRGGTEYTHRPLNKQEPKPKPEIPPCPRHLEKEARREWRRMARELDNVSLLTRLDKAVFAIYCSSWSTWKEASQKLASTGMVIKSPKNYPMINPYLSIQRSAESQMIKCLVEIGMSPSSRASLNVEKPKQKSKAELFMARKHGANS